MARPSYSSIGVRRQPFVTVRHKQAPVRLTNIQMLKKSPHASPYRIYNNEMTISCGYERDDGHASPLTDIFEVLMQQVREVLGRPTEHRDLYSMYIYRFLAI